jgi:hypothetical protein
MLRGVIGMKASFLVAAALLASAPCSANPPLPGSNLVINPDFSGSLAGWTSNFATFDATRTATADGTGSALGSFTLPTGAAFGNANGLTQCVTGIVPGKPYFFGGKVFLPSGQGGTGGGSIALQWYSSSACGGFITNATTDIAITPTDATDVWHALQAVSTAPAGAAGALVIGEIQNNAGEGNSFAVNFDEIFLQTQSPTQPAIVPATGMPGRAALVALLAASGILLLRSRLF